MIRNIDHVVITTRDPMACLGIYEKLGFLPRINGDRYELYAGDFKINVHVLGNEHSPHAGNVQTGSADLCFEIDGSLETYQQTLEKMGFQIELGVVERSGAKGGMRSIYLRDPDGNLLEFCSYQ